MEGPSPAEQIGARGVGEIGRGDAGAFSRGRPKW